MRDIYGPGRTEGITVTGKVNIAGAFEQGGLKLANNFPRKIGGKKRMSVSRHARSSAPNLPPREKGIG